MTILHAIQPLYVIAGFIVGALVGITGVGGGALMTPVLIFFGISPITAVATDLLYASITKTGGTLIHGYNHTVDWRVVVRLATGSIPGAALTLFVLYELHIGGEATRDLVSTVLGVALLLTALALLFRKPLTRYFVARVGELEAELVRWLTIAAGALLGILVSISSVGAGAIGVTILILLYPKMSTARIVGSDIAHSVPLTLAAGLGHGLLSMVNTGVSSIDGTLLVTLLIGSLPGIFVGSYLANRLPDSVVRLTLASVLLIVCAKLLLF
jgi:uncharacterized membrane protein YfcA